MFYKKGLSTIYLGNLKSDSLERALTIGVLHASKRFACTPAFQYSNSTWLLHNTTLKSRCFEIIGISRV